jgi:hypothetical protein
MYPNAEYYEFNIPVKDLIQRINEFKDLNPEYKVIQISTEGNETEYHDGYTGDFYMFYFYSKDIDRTIHCAAYGRMKNTSLVCLLAVSEGTEFKDYKEINTKDITKELNTQIKNKFEVKILNKLKHDWIRKKLFI